MKTITATMWIIDGDFCCACMSDAFDNNVVYLDNVKSGYVLCTMLNGGNAEQIVFNYCPWCGEKIERFQGGMSTRRTD